MNEKSRSMNEGVKGKENITTLIGNDRDRRKNSEEQGEGDKGNRQAGKENKHSHGSRQRNRDRDKGVQGGKTMERTSNDIKN